MNSRHIWLAAAISTVLLFSTAHSSFGSVFTNQFVEFELPPQWQCSLEGAEWVCQSSDVKKKTDGIIVLAAKMKGDQDSLDQYRAYLKNPKNFTAINGKQLKSEVKYVRDSALRESQMWVDALHYESELPEYFTRYLATVKQDMGVVVTYSINKMKYQIYTNDFEAMVKTLKVFRKQGALNAGGQAGNIFDQAKIPAGVAQETVFGAATPSGGSDQPQAPVEKKDDFTFYLIIAGVAVVGFIIWKKKQSAG